MIGKLPRLVLAVATVLAALLVVGGADRREASARAQSIDSVLAITPWEIQPEKQRLFDEPKHGIDSLRAAGFNTVAFVRPDQIEKVERAGMRALVGRPGARVSWATLSDREIVEYVRGVVDAAGESEAILGYFLADEPSASEFRALGKAVAAVKRLAPGKLAYVNVFPNYATSAQLGTKTYAEYLERYVSQVKPQLLSYDNYSVQLSMDLADRARGASYFTNLLAVRRVARKHGVPFWNAVSSNQIRPFTTVPSPANLLLQAYTTLAAGGRGLTWFTYYAGNYEHAPIDAAGNRTATWSYLRMVNAQVQGLAPILTRVRGTGVYFTAPTPAAGLPRLPGTLIRSISAPVPTMVGELAGSGSEKYALVVNLSLRRSAKIVVNARSDRVRVVSPVDRSLAPLAAGSSLWLPAGQGALLKL